VSGLSVTAASKPLALAGRISYARYNSDYALQFCCQEARRFGAVPCGVPTRGPQLLLTLVYYKLHWHWCVGGIV